MDPFFSRARFSKVLTPSAHNSSRTHIWAYLDVLAYIWALGPSAYISFIWAYLLASGLSGHIWAYLFISGHVWTYQDTSGRICLYLGVSGRSQAHWTANKRSPQTARPKMGWRRCHAAWRLQYLAYLNIPAHIWTYLGVSAYIWHIWAYLHVSTVSGHILAFLLISGIPGFIQAYFVPLGVSGSISPYVAYLGVSVHFCLSLCILFQSVDPERP